MRKKLFIIGTIVILLGLVVYIAWQMYDLSSDYNYASAKIDIKNGELKIIHVGTRRNTSKDKEIDSVAARYGFKNVYIEKYTPQQTEKGIKHYTRLIESYLVFRNGVNWRKDYQRQVDSLYKIAN